MSGHHICLPCRHRCIYKRCQFITMPCKRRAMIPSSMKLLSQDQSTTTGKTDALCAILMPQGISSSSLQHTQLMRRKGRLSCSGRTLHAWHLRPPQALWNLKLPVKPGQHHQAGGHNINLMPPPASSPWPANPMTGQLQLNLALLKMQLPRTRQCLLCPQLLQPCTCQYNTLVQASTHLVAALLAIQEKGRQTSI